MSYIIWIPICLIYYMLYYVASKYNQDFGGKWFLIVLIMGAFPGWAIVSRYTTNILWDGLIYDLILMLTLPATMILMGEAHGYTLIEWIGLSMAISGLVLMRI